VTRMVNSNLPEPKLDLSKPMPAAWKRSQDHFERFTTLIRQELDDETAIIEDRWKTWTKQRLQLNGVALFDLVGRRQGQFFGEPILIFESRDHGRLPDHRFSPGDIVIISRSRPYGEKITEGMVLDRGPTRVRVLVAQSPKELKKGVWRLDRGANRVAHDRMHEALIQFHSTEGNGGTVLRDLLL